MCERVEGWQDMHHNDRVVEVMDRACGDEAVGRAVERLWQRRFTACRPRPFGLIILFIMTLYIQFNIQIMI